MLPASPRLAAARRGVELADIFRAHGESYRRAHPLPVSHLKIMQAVERCRTAALGGHLEQCDSCGYERPAYNSCRNRHCPKCQSLAKVKWLDKQKSELLPVGILPSGVHLAARAQRSDTDQQKDPVKSSL
jgi:predicted Zn-ribbon and HTH transcriptional regulator